MASDESERTEDTEERRELGRILILKEPDSENVDRNWSALEEDRRDLNGPGLESVGQGHLNFPHIPQLSPPSLHHRLECCGSLHLLLRMFIKRSLCAALTSEEQLERRDRSKDDFRVKLTDGEVLKVGVDETEGAKDVRVEASEENDEGVELERKRWDGHAEGKKGGWMRSSPIAECIDDVGRGREGEERQERSSGRDEAAQTGSEELQHGRLKSGK